MSQKENKEPPSLVKQKNYNTRSKTSIMGGEELALKGGLALYTIPKVILGRKSQSSKSKTIDELEIKAGKKATIKGPLE